MQLEQLLATAATCRQTGDLRSADALYASVLAQEPRNADAWHLRGVVAHQMGDRGLATGCLEQAVALAPGRAAFWSNLGLCYLAGGRLDEALGCLHRALGLEPGLLQARINLANALNEKSAFSAAEAECRVVLHLQPDLPQAHNNLGVALTGQDRHEEAIACYRRAVRLAPTMADAHRNLAHALAETGAFDEARQEYETVVTLNPRETRALFGLSLIKRYAPHDQADFQRLEMRLRDPLLSARERADLNFALGKMCDDCGLYDRAFGHFRRANDAVRPAWDRDACAQAVQAMIDAFRPERVAAPRAGHLSQQPIFIVGMPRSGTTLVEQILATNPQIAACGELPDIQQMALDLEAQTPAGISWPDCLLQIGDEGLRPLAERYLSARLARHPGVRHTVDKMPTNFFHLGLIWRVFPNARVIHCQRDPRDVCLSCYFANFSTPMDFAYDLGHLGFFCRLQERIMAHWRSVLPLAIHAVSYENLVADPGAEIRRLVDFCNVPWDDCYLRHHDARGVVRTTSGWQVRRPIYRTSSGRWRNYERHLGPLFAALRDLG
jgi:Flp pilus assembly protein TadD